MQGLAALAGAFAVAPAVLVQEPAVLTLPPLSTPPVSGPVAGRLVRIPMLVQSTTDRYAAGSAGQGTLHLARGTSGSVTFATETIPWSMVRIHGLESAVASRSTEAHRHMILRSLRQAGGANLFVSERPDPLWFLADKPNLPGLRAYPTIHAPGHGLLEMEWRELPGDTLLSFCGLAEIVEDPLGS